MSMSKGYPHNIGGTVFAVVSGRGGNCLVLGDENGGTRISGPKPWGGGRTIMEFVTDEEYGPTEVLESENERLREFVQAVAEDSYHGNLINCTECRFFGGCYNNKKKEHAGRGCQWYLWSRELGIEVPQ